jgi:hypothetical protein
MDESELLKGLLAFVARKSFKHSVKTADMSAPFYMSHAVAKKQIAECVSNAAGPVNVFVDSSLNFIPIPSDLRSAA